MGRGATAQVRSWLTTLCVALSLVFASSSAASVLDRIQHSAQLPHEHGVTITASLVDDDHADHGGEPADHQQDDQDSADHQSGAGHHHVDAPLASVVRGGGAEASTSIVDVSLLSQGAEGAKGTRPGGLDRPPKAIAKLV